MMTVTSSQAASTADRNCVDYAPGTTVTIAHNGHYDTSMFVDEYDQSWGGQHVHYHIWRNLTHDYTNQVLCYADN